MESLPQKIFGRGNVSRFLGRFFSVDWVLLGAIVPLLAYGLLTMNSFGGENRFFEKQLIWIGVSLLVFFVFALFDFRFLRRSGVIVSLYLGIIAILTLLFGMGAVFKGAQSWFNVGLFTIQPSDPAKLILILVLSKYFSRRHMEIAHIRHILISGFYTLILFLLVLVQPDFGSAVILACIWFGMVLVSGISKKHLVLVFGLAIMAGIFSWTYVFQDYQKTRILTFLILSLMFGEQVTTPINPQLRSALVSSLVKVLATVLNQNFNFCLSMRPILFLLLLLKSGGISVCSFSFCSLV